MPPSYSRHRHFELTISYSEDDTLLLLLLLLFVTYCAQSVASLYRVLSTRPVTCVYPFVTCNPHRRDGRGVVVVAGGGRAISTSNPQSLEKAFCNMASSLQTLIQRRQQHTYIYAIVCACVICFILQSLGGYWNVIPSLWCAVVKVYTHASSLFMLKSQHHPEQFSLISI